MIAPRWNRNEGGRLLFLKRIQLRAESFRRRAQRIVREMERYLQTGYKTGYEMRLADYDCRILADFGGKFGFNVRGEWR